MRVINFLGFAFELFGLGLAAWGFWRTWKDNAEGRAFFPPRTRRAATWFRRHILRRPPRNVVIHGSAAGVFSLWGDGHGYVSSLFRDDMTLDDKVGVAQENALRALKDANTVAAAVSAEKRAREQAIKEIDARITNTEHSLTQQTRGLIVDGIPVAVSGLVFAALGLALQAIATLTMQ